VECSSLSFSCKNKGITLTRTHIKCPSIIS
jgi:hypothetical protein